MVAATREVSAVKPPPLVFGPTGERFEFQTSARSPGGDGVFRFRWTLQPGKKGPPEHVHDDESETFSIVSGTLRIWIDKTSRDYGPGETVTVHKGRRHRFLNPGKVPVVVDVALDGPNMEDSLVPLALHIGTRKIRLRDIAVMMVTSVRARGSRPPQRIGIAIVRGFAALMRMFGVKALPPAGAW